MNTWNFFYSLDYNPILLLLLELFPVLTIGSCDPLTYLRHCFCLFLSLFVLSSFSLSGTRMFQAHLVYLLLQFSNQPVLQRTLVLFIEKNIRNQYLGTRCSMIFKLLQCLFLLSGKNCRHQIFGKNAVMSAFFYTENDLESKESLNTHTHIYNQPHFNRKQQKWQKSLLKRHSALAR